MLPCLPLYNYEIGLSFVPDGTISVSADMDTVTGFGTEFLTQLAVGYLIRAGDQWRVISSISSNTLLTVSANFDANVSNQPFLAVSMRNVESLTTPLPAPKGEYEPWTESIKLASGGYRGMGQARGRWRWGFLKQAMRDQLRTFVPGKSAHVYIRTRTNDDADAYAYFSARAMWPDGNENKDGKFRLNFVFEFENLELIQVN